MNDPCGHTKYIAECYSCFDRAQGELGTLDAEVIILKSRLLASEAAREKAGERIEDMRRVCALRDEQFLDLKARAEAAERERDELKAQVKRWEDKEVTRGSHCSDMEEERDAARAEAAAMREALEDARINFMRCAINGACVCEASAEAVEQEIHSPRKPEGGP